MLMSYSMGVLLIGFYLVLVLELRKRTAARPKSFSGTTDKMKSVFSWVANVLRTLSPARKKRATVHTRLLHEFPRCGAFLKNQQFLQKDITSTIVRRVRF